MIKFAVFATGGKATLSSSLTLSPAQSKSPVSLSLKKHHSMTEGSRHLLPKSAQG